MLLLLRWTRGHVSFHKGQHGGPDKDKLLSGEPGQRLSAHQGLLLVERFKVRPGPVSLFHRIGHKPLDILVHMASHRRLEQVLADCPAESFRHSGEGLNAVLIGGGAQDEHRPLSLMHPQPPGEPVLNPRFPLEFPGLLLLPRADIGPLGNQQVQLFALSQPFPNGGQRLLRSPEVPGVQHVFPLRLDQEHIGILGGVFHADGGHPNIVQLNGMAIPKPKVDLRPGLVGKVGDDV